MSFITIAFSAAAKDIGGMISATLGLWDYMVQG